MNITLPGYKEEYLIGKAGYDRIIGDIKPKLSRALQIYEAYLRTGNEVLYESFALLASALHSKFYLLSTIDTGVQQLLWDKAKQLEKAAEIVSGSDELPYKSTMLHDLAGVISGR